MNSFRALMFILICAWIIYGIDTARYIADKNLNDPLAVKVLSFLGLAS